MGRLRHFAVRLQPPVLLLAKLGELPGRHIDPPQVWPDAPWLPSIPRAGRGEISNRSSWRRAMAALRRSISASPRQEDVDLSSLSSPRFWEFVSICAKILCLEPSAFATMECSYLKNGANHTTFRTRTSRIEDG